jgi:hypothetical protein
MVRRILSPSLEKIGEKLDDSSVNQARLSRHVVSGHRREWPHFVGARESEMGEMADIALAEVPSKKSGHGNFSKRRAAEASSQPPASTDQD